MKRLAEAEAIGELLSAEERSFAKELYRAWLRWSVEPAARESLPPETGRDLVVDDIPARQRPFYAWLESADGQHVRDEVFGPLEDKLSRIVRPRAERLCADCDLPGDALNTKLTLPSDIFVLPRGWLKDAFSVMEKVVDRWMNPILYSKPFDWCYRTTAPLFPRALDRFLTERVGDVAATGFGWSEEDKVKLTEAIREQVQEQLLERAKGIESLLA